MRLRDLGVALVRPEQDKTVDFGIGEKERFRELLLMICAARSSRSIRNLVGGFQQNIPCLRQAV
jgi:hypothetical protein